MERGYTLRLKSVYLELNILGRNRISAISSFYDLKEIT